MANFRRPGPPSAQVRRDPHGLESARSPLQPPGAFSLGPPTSPERLGRLLGTGACVGEAYLLLDLVPASKNFGPRDGKSLREAARAAATGPKGGSHPRVMLLFPPPGRPFLLEIGCPGAPRRPRWKSRRLLLGVFTALRPPPAHSAQSLPGKRGRWRLRLSAQGVLGTPRILPASSDTLSRIFRLTAPTPLTPFG